MISLDELNEYIAAVLPEVTEFRHALHRIPEIAGQEFQTSALIRQKLETLNLEIRKPYLKTDVTALLNP
ncbi:MAG: amidohydrolase, partial [Lentisphaeria bacterium]|nr:amidohydrolase [Lentisphaeria bacterium]